MLGVSQGSILGSFLFNIFLCDLFFIMNNTDFASYADDNAPYTIGHGIEDVIQRHKATLKNLFQWFSNNKMQVDTYKRHFICSSNQITNCLTVENDEIASNASFWLLNLTPNSYSMHT